MPLSIEKKRAATKAINELHRIAVTMVEKSGLDLFDQIGGLKDQAASQLVAIQNAICEHPAFSVGRCVVCKQTYAEAGV
jgi:hypothetical protein